MVDTLSLVSTVSSEALRKMALLCLSSEHHEAYHDQ